MVSTQQVREARYFAAGAHAAVGQLRKYTYEPYIVHPEEVARIVMAVPHTPEMLMAAYLHDTVEDTKVSLAEIRLNFGQVVAHYVGGLTHAVKKAGENRAFRMKVNVEFLRSQCAEVQTVKVADLISNTSSIVQYDPKFAAVYLREKQDLLHALTKADPTLLERAWITVNAGLKQLEKTA